MGKFKRYGWETVDEQGSQCMINKYTLSVDDNYQRSSTYPKVLKIASQWSWMACGAIIVAQRDNVYYVIDGQHRVMAAMKRDDIVDLPCIVFKTIDMREEARGFLMANTQRKPMIMINKFKALKAIGNKEALLVQGLADETGRNISQHSGAAYISCVGALMRMAETTPETLKRMWPTIIKICDGYIIKDRIVLGLIYLENNIQEGESLIDKKWENRLIKIGYGGIDGAILKAASYYSWGGDKVYAEGILNAINKGLQYPLKTKNKIEIRVRA